ncbi:MAG: TetR/AcrR family transcriptional regulator [Proteobacteria bacterium]|nr:TetR/AcrR family transcriptional regulator [Pseudomonadota bacterium]
MRRTAAPTKRKARGSSAQAALRAEHREFSLATAGGATPRMRVSSLKTRETILAAATIEFAEKGYDGAHMDEIAVRAGIQKNVLYYYFGSKEGLFTAVLERTYESIRARQEEAGIRDLDPVGAMRKLVFFTGENWGRHPEFLRLLQSENLNKGRHIRSSKTIPRMYNPLLDAIREQLARGAAAGVFRDDIDPVDLYISITSLSAHYVSHQHTFEAIFGRRLMTPQRMKQRLEHAADMVVRYLLREPVAGRGGAARKKIPAGTATR